MKRSAQVGLLMGALGASTAGAYYLENRDPACQTAPQSNPQAGPLVNPQPNPAQRCRRSFWRWGSSWGRDWDRSRPIFSTGPSAAPARPSVVSPSAPSAAPSVQRSGFGSFVSRIVSSGG